MSFSRSYLHLITIFLFFLVCRSAAFSQKAPVLVYQLQEEITPGSARIMAKVFREAEKIKAEKILIRMNTYGGLLDAGDSIRSLLLRSKIPVIVLVENNAASAGALISLAANKIYMLPGSSIGAATVVNENAEALPDKYQSYMRSMMRATAEARGRNPRIAEAMVDGRIVVEGINDSGRVVTLTSSEALKAGICDGIVHSQQEVLNAENSGQNPVVNYQTTWFDKLTSWLMHPAVSGVLILLMLGGLYYEMQHPGIGLPLLIAIVAALLYFAPLYIDGLAENWEILVVIAGLGLILAEIFIIPGFGIIGISGIALLMLGLIFSMLPNKGFDFGLVSTISIYRSVAIILMSMTGVLTLFLFTSRVMANSPFFQKYTLRGELSSADGYSTAVYSETGVGAVGIAITDLRPSGKIEINGETFPASAETGYIVAGSTVIVTGNRPGLVVKVG